jgi:hypothetical protein
MGFATAKNPVHILFRLPYLSQDLKINRIFAQKLSSNPPAKQ